MFGHRPSAELALRCWMTTSQGHKMRPSADLLLARILEPPELRSALYYGPPTHHPESFITWLYCLHTILMPHLDLLCTYYQYESATNPSMQEHPVPLFSFSCCGLNLYFLTSGVMSKYASPSNGQGVLSLGICLHEGATETSGALSAWGS